MTAVGGLSSPLGRKSTPCNVITPGFTDTPMRRDTNRGRSDRASTVPFGRHGTGRQVAHAALLVISNESSHADAQPRLLDAGHMAGIVRG